MCDGFQTQSAFYGAHPPITVVLPMHNSSAFIVDQVQSILDQNYPAVEMLILDDGSSDDSIDLLEEHFGTCQRINVLRNKVAAGQNAAIDAMLQRVTTPLFAISDHDDVWMPHKLSATVDELLRTGTDLCYSDLRVVSRDLREVAESAFRFAGMPVVQGRRTLPILVKNPVHGCTIVGHRRLLTEALPFPSGARHYDRWLALVAASRGGVSCVTEPLILYRQHDANAIGALPFSVSGLGRRAGGRNASAVRGFARDRLDARTAYVAALTKRNAASFGVRALGRYWSLPRILRAGLSPLYLITLGVGASELPWRTAVADAALVATAPTADRRSALRHHIVTLDEDALRDACRLLVADVEKSGYRPTHLVAVAKAGVHVAHHMASAFDDVPAIVEIEARRPATRMKSAAGFRSVLARAPRWLTTTLRHAEFRLITVRNRSGERAVFMASEHLETLRAAGAGARLLVVDDCVDSGLSLEMCIAHLRCELDAEVELRTAVLAASLPDPKLIPDYCIYPSTTLRGPWSFDA